MFLTTFLNGFVTYSLESYVAVVISKCFNGRPSVFSLDMLIYTSTVVLFGVVMLQVKNSIPPGYLLMLGVLVLFFICCLNKLKIH